MERKTRQQLCRQRYRIVYLLHTQVPSDAGCAETFQVVGGPPGAESPFSRKCSYMFTIACNCTKILSGKGLLLCIHVHSKRAFETCLPAARYFEAAEYPFLNPSLILCQAFSKFRHLVSAALFWIFFKRSWAPALAGRKSCVQNSPACLQTLFFRPFKALDGFITNLLHSRETQKLPKNTN